MNAREIMFAWNDKSAKQTNWQRYADYSQLRFVKVPLSVFIRKYGFRTYAIMLHTSSLSTLVFLSFSTYPNLPLRKKVDKNLTDIYIYIYVEVDVLLVNTHISYKDKASLCQILEELITRVNQSTNKCSYWLKYVLRL
jgi:hypothetical protein